MNTRNKAFSLIELLVVLAIVSVMAAILFPAFVSIREKDHQAACAGNLKQLALAYDQYTHDNNGYFPGVARQDAGWAYPLYPYVKSYSTYQCPDDPVSTPTQPHISYGQNANLNDSVDATQNRIDFTYGKGPAFGLASIKSPNLTVLLFETTNKIDGPNVHFNTMGLANDEGGSCTGNGYDNMWIARYATGVMGGRQGKDNNGNPTAAAPRHVTGSNFLAVDGHVAFLPGGKVSNGYTPPSATDPEGNYAPSGGWATAAGTSSMADDAGKKYVLTFSTL